VSVKLTVPAGYEGDGDGSTVVPAMGEVVVVGDDDGVAEVSTDGVTVGLGDDPGPQAVQTRPMVATEQLRVRETFLMV